MGGMEKEPPPILGIPQKDILVQAVSMAFLASMLTIFHMFFVYIFKCI